jgi:hypothetical protein
MARIMKFLEVKFYLASYCFFILGTVHSETPNLCYRSGEESKVYSLKGSKIIYGVILIISL